MPEVAFVMPPHQQPGLRELAETLAYELKLQAVASSLHVGRFPASRLDRVYALLNPSSYVSLEGVEALPDDAVLARTILLWVEQPPTNPADADMRLLRRAGAVFAIDQRAVVTLTRLGIRARLLRPGYTQTHDHFDAAADRPIDVMFFGAHTHRRTRYLNHAARVLARLDCQVHFAVREPSTDPATSSLGEDKWPLLAQAKVVINLHGGEQTRVEWRRVLDAIHAGAVVVTEHSSGIAPLVAGEHLLVASPEAVPYVAESLVRDPERLAALRRAAYDRLSTWIPFALPVAVLRAAVVELVGEPLPPGVSLGGHRASSAPEPQESADDGAASSSLAAEAGVEATADVDVLEESPAWASREAPRVTVLTAVTGVAGDHGLTATLDSVVQSGMRDVELVIVIDGSTRTSAATVTKWMQAHPRTAARLVAARADASLGAARNAALHVARAPLCLPLDAGQEVYPRCLGALADVMDRHPEIAFAYPIQEVTGAPDRFADAGGDHLMSFLAWDARRLRHGNYVHSPAMIRRNILRAVGGFTTDDRLSGFEDYDLWCRIAEIGGRGRMVAQVLARRPESERSDVLATIHPAPGSHTRALAERAPRLLTGAFTPAQ
jgi:hypothetical protein